MSKSLAPLWDARPVVYISHGTLGGLQASRLLDQSVSGDRLTYTWVHGGMSRHGYASKRKAERNRNFNNVHPSNPITVEPGRK